MNLMATVQLMEISGFIKQKFQAVEAGITEKYNIIPIELKTLM
jgi:hypothetical protein